MSQPYTTVKVDGETLRRLRILAAHADEHQYETLARLVAEAHAALTASLTHPAPVPPWQPVGGWEAQP